VEPVAEFPLLQDDYKIVPCDKEKLCDHASLISTTQLVHEHDTSILDDTHAEVRRVHCVDSEKEELEIISSLNCLGYIDVDINIGDTSTPTHNQISGPITQARARQLNNQVSLFLASYSSYLDNGNVCSVLLLRNDGQEGNRVGFARATFGFQNSSTL
jgi:hypothetical protein